MECGALDGERASNSLPLESSRQWTGILIEANPYYYTQLLGKNRNVWSLNACLSPYDYATQVRRERRKCFSTFINIMCVYELSVGSKMIQRRLLCLLALNVFWSSPVSAFESFENLLQADERFVFDDLSHLTTIII